MSKNELVKKNLKLSADLSSYLIDNPDKAKGMPNKACVVFEVPNNKELSRKNLKLAREMWRKGKKCYVATKERNNGWSWRLITASQ